MVENGERRMEIGEWRLEIGRGMWEWREVTGGTLDGDLVTRWGDGRSSEDTSVTANAGGFLANVIPGIDVLLV
jgi:hypothetical protein